MIFFGGPEFRRSGPDSRESFTQRLHLIHTLAGYKPVDRLETTNVSEEDLEYLECLTDEELDLLISLKRKMAESAETRVKHTTESAEKN